jgi:hypothetical protein
MSIDLGRCLYLRSPLMEPRRPLIGVAVGCVAGLITAIVDGGHWFVSAVIVAMAADLWLVLRFCLRLSDRCTRQLFEAAELKRGRLLSRAVTMFVISVIFLIFSIHKIPLIHGEEKPLHLSVYFIGVMLCWLELQLAFATYYAKIYFKNNPLEPETSESNQTNDEDEGPQELIFPGADEPVFSDFLYVSVTIALTFSMSDVSIESSRLRRTILTQSLLSFIFYTMIFSVVANLLISNS